MFGPYAVFLKALGPLEEVAPEPCCKDLPLSTLTYLSPYAQAFGKVSGAEFLWTFIFSPTS